MRLYRMHVHENTGNGTLFSFHNVFSTFRTTIVWMQLSLRYQISGLIPDLR